LTDVVERQQLEQAVPLAALFTAFLAVSLCGIGDGGGVVWARRISVEKRRWLTDKGPDGPTRSTTSPCDISNDTSCRAVICLCPRR
jgi:hypothetical protein